MRPILLARPHPFIVAEMAPFLKEAGFEGRRLTALEQLPAQVQGTSGAIISLALVSDLKASVDAVFTSLRTTAPRLAVVFAGLIDLDGAKLGLQQLAAAHGVTALIASAGDGPLPSGAARNPATFLYIGKRDLAEPARRATTMQNLQHHFR